MLLLLLLFSYTLFSDMMADDQVAVPIEPTELTEDDEDSGMGKYGLKPIKRE